VDARNIDDARREPYREARSSARALGIGLLLALLVATALLAKLGLSWLA
jgi:hypothetical protein